MARLTEIGNQIATLLATIPDIGSINAPNVSQMTMPAVNVTYRRESSVNDLLSHYGYADCEFVLTLRCALSAVVDYPPDAIDAEYDTWLNNIRDTIESRNGDLGLSYNPVITYTGFERIPEGHGDAFTPGKMEIYYTVRYQYNEIGSVGSSTSSNSSSSTSTSSSSNSSSSSSD